MLLLLAFCTLSLLVAASEPYSYDELVRFGPEVDILKPERLNFSPHTSHSTLRERPNGFMWTDLNNNGFPDAIMAWQTGDNSNTIPFFFRPLLDAPTTPAYHGYLFAPSFRFTHAPYSKVFRTRGNYNWYTAPHAVATYYSWVAVDDVLAYTTITRFRSSNGMDIPTINTYFGVRFDYQHNFDILGSPLSHSSRTTDHNLLHATWRQHEMFCGSNTTHLRRCFTNGDVYGVSWFSAKYSSHQNSDLFLLQHSSSRNGITFGIFYNAASKIKSNTIGREDLSISDASLPILCSSSSNCEFKTVSGDFEGKGNLDLLVCAFNSASKKFNCYIGLEFANIQQLNQYRNEGIEVLHAPKSLFRQVFGPFSVPSDEFSSMPEVITLAPGMKEGFMMIYRREDQLMSRSVNLFISTDFS
ncbi:hypothetical protein RCL1_003429 [Eukaryota sp. TZLM3-RCL]